MRSIRDEIDNVIRGAQNEMAKLAHSQRCPSNLYWNLRNSRIRDSIRAEAWRQAVSVFEGEGPYRA